MNKSTPEDHSVASPRRAFANGDLRMSVIHILIVDNFLPWQDFVQELFELEVDLKVIGTAIDGFEGIQKAIGLRPDVILMDVGLPGMSGLEASRHIRILCPASKILFLSEDRGSELIQVAFQLGGFGYILKSDSHSDLLIGIRAVLSGQRFVSRSLTDLLNFFD